MIDPSADVVVGAVVTLSNKITGYKQSATTDEQGVAGFNNVPFDDYDVVIEALRFQQANRRITVRSNLPVELDVKLAVPGSQKTVTVEGIQIASFLAAENTVDSKYHQRSWWIVDTQPTNRLPRALLNPTNAVGGLFILGLQPLL